MRVVPLHEFKTSSYTPLPIYEVRFYAKGENIPPGDYVRCSYTDDVPLYVSMDETWHRKNGHIGSGGTTMLSPFPVTRVGGVWTIWLKAENEYGEIAM